MEKTVDLIIVGAGPAGMTAAIYASRAGLNVMMLEGGTPGGKLVKTNEISNWPGIIKESGADLAIQMFEHATSFGAEYVYGDVSQIKVDGEWKDVILQDGTAYRAKAVIVAAGTKERLLNIPGEDRNIGRGISYCAVCDGAFFKDKNVAIIGAGNAALEEALYITQFAKKVSIIMRRDVFRADKIAVDAVKSHEKIEILQKYIPVEILDDGKHVTGLKIKHTESGEERVLDVEGIFPYIGADPATSFLSDLGILDQQGYMIVDENMETKIPLLYGAGDVCQKVLRQVVTAVNDGAIAAQDAFKKIKM